MCWPGKKLSVSGPSTAALLLCVGCVVAWPILSMSAPSFPGSSSTFATQKQPNNAFRYDLRQLTKLIIPYLAQSKSAPGPLSPHLTASHISAPMQRRKEFSNGMVEEPEDADSFDPGIKDFELPTPLEKKSPERDYGT